MQKLYKFEQETIILWNEDDRKVCIETFETKLINIFDKAVAKYPECIQFLGEDEYGCRSYEVSRDSLSINFIKPISEERRKQLSESGKMGWQKANSSQGSAN